VFIHAGAGKLFYTMPLSGPPAAKLVGFGLAEPQSPGGGGEGVIDPGDTGTGTSTDVPGPTEPVPPADDIAPPTGPENLPPPENLAHPDPGDGGQKPDVTVVLPANQDADPALIGEFEVSRRLGLVLAMDGASRRGQWPPALSTPEALNALAWAAALTEFIGGWLVLIGLMTRIWALGLAGTMAVALWLTQVGPSLSLDSGAFLGFLPPMEMDDPMRWTAAWKDLFLQFTLFCCAGALMLQGAGILSLDGLLFGGAGRHHPPRTSSPHTPAKRGDTMKA
jgi:uncharacterized membrane protein YphA (DoxX/SURF4 family)